MVDRAQPIDDREFRFWLADGRVVTRAPYSLSALPSTTPPLGVTKLAMKVADRFSDRAGLLVADFALDAGGVAWLVEMNALSTSGFYPGMDTKALLSEIDTHLL